MIGVLVNTIAVIIGSFIGLIIKKGIPTKLTTAVMTGIGLCTIYIGITGTLKGNDVIVLIISIVIGSIIGTLLNIDGQINKLGEIIERKVSKKNTSNSIATGFVTACLLFCIGAMTIVGSLNAGFGDNSTLFAKSLLDFISSIMLSASLGIGVMFSAAFVLIFQGAIAILAQYIQPFLGTFAQNELICVGSLLIIALGLNIIGITKIRVANYLPAIIIAPILCNIINVLNLGKYI